MSCRKLQLKREKKNTYTWSTWLLSKPWIRQHRIRHIHTFSVSRWFRSWPPPTISITFSNLCYHSRMINCRRFIAAMTYAINIFNYFDCCQNSIFIWIQHIDKQINTHRKMECCVGYKIRNTYLELDRFDESFLPACKFGRSFWRFFVSRQIR